MDWTCARQRLQQRRTWDKKERGSRSSSSHDCGCLGGCILCFDVISSCMCVCLWPALWVHLCPLCKEVRKWEIGIKKKTEQEHGAWWKPVDEALACRLSGGEGEEIRGTERVKGSKCFVVVSIPVFFACGYLVLVWRMGCRCIRCECDLFICRNRLLSDSARICACAIGLILVVCSERVSKVKDDDHRQTWEHACVCFSPVTFPAYGNAYVVYASVIWSKECSWKVSKCPNWERGQRAVPNNYAVIFFLERFLRWILLIKWEILGNSCGWFMSPVRREDQI